MREDSAEGNHRFSLSTTAFTNVEKAQAEKLTDILSNIHKGVVLEVKAKRGRAPTKYKKFEPYKIDGFFTSYNPRGKALIDIAADILSGLLRAHPFPNANHRTTLTTIQALFKANDLRFPHYENATPRWRSRYVSDCNRFITESKYWLKLRLSRDKLGKDVRVLQVTKTRKHSIAPGDLDLTKSQMAQNHLAMTREWLLTMLGNQSDKYRRVSPDALTRLIAQAES